MTSSQSVYDIEYVYGEFGGEYEILVKNDDGTNAVLTAFDAAQMTVSKMDDTVLFTATNLTSLVISSPNILWTMEESETTALGYDGKIKVQIELTTSTTAKRMTKTFTGFIHKNQVP